MEELETVELHDGLSITDDVLTKLLDLEANGLTFETLADGRFTCEPRFMLGREDVAWLTEHRDVVRQVVAYSIEATARRGRLQPRSVGATPRPAVN